MAARKNILIVNPWIYDFAAYDLWVKPIALLYFASLLRKSCNVELIDSLDGVKGPGKRTAEKSYGCRKFFKEEVQKPKAYRSIPRRYSRYGMNLKDFKNRLKEIRRPDLALVGSMMTYWYEGAEEAVRLIKEFYPDVPVVLGGKYAEICHEHALKNSCADKIIKARSFKEAIDVLNRDFKIGLDLGMDFGDSDFPYPAWDLYSDLRYACVLTSMGCPFKCSYCYTPLWSSKYVEREPGSVVSEIEYLNKNLAVRNFAFYDDALNFNGEKRLKPILRKIIEKKLSIYLHTPNAIHAKWMDDELAALMMNAGFKTVRLGFETSDDLVNIRLGGKIKTEEFERCVASLRDAGFTFENLGAYLLTGIPGQRYEDLLRDIDYLIDLGVRPYIAEYSPIPGTPLFDEARRISRFDLNDPLCQNNSILPVRNPDFDYSHLEKAKDYLRNKLKTLADDSQDSD